MYIRMEKPFLFNEHYFSPMPFFYWGENSFYYIHNSSLFVHKKSTPFRYGFAKQK